ncbi:MAG: type II/IV secretion system protein [Candidatus Taylorbacteria bacterium]|nr:type II/IV secretion system protein [Candidatus Taylorbacteria bacterium]
MVIQFDEEKQNQHIEELRKKEEEDVAKMLAEKYEVEFINLMLVPINTDALRLIKEENARAAKIAAFNLVGKKVQVAVLSFTSEETRRAIHAITDAGYSVIVFITTTEGLMKAWSHYKDLSYSTESTVGALEVSSSEIDSFLSKVHTIKDIGVLIQNLLSEKKSYKISRIIELIIAGALATKASDIHIEPEESYARLRFRLDGVLNDVLNFDREIFGLVLNRIKLLSGLKLNIKTEAQDGRFSVKINNSDIEIRTSLLPGAYSESIVMRILNPKSISVPIEELGIAPNLLKILMHEIDKPSGMLLTTGPTGSGKTTTLYAFLRKVHTSDIKIITIEDPIEYHLPGIVQTQTNAEKGYTFLEGLRSALRQDPDIIMVGEIRDVETAEIAVNAALTGHLVLSTLHTNTAAGTFPRLIDLGVNAKTISSAISVAMAQRLVRKLCQECKKEVSLDANTKILVDKTLASLKDKSEVGNTTKMWTEVGCDKCNHTGYKGRVGIYEAILMDDAIEAIVRENPSEREIQKAAEPQGIPTLRQDGIIKLLAGITSLNELSRIVDLEKS